MSNRRENVHRYLTKQQTNLNTIYVMVPSNISLIKLIGVQSNSPINRVLGVNLDAFFSGCIVKLTRVALPETRRQYINKYIPNWDNVVKEKEPDKKDKEVNKKELVKKATQINLEIDTQENSLVFKDYSVRQDAKEVQTEPHDDRKLELNYNQLHYMRLLNADNPELMNFDNVQNNDNRDLIEQHDTISLNGQEMNEQWNLYLKEILEILRDNVPDARSQNYKIEAKSLNKQCVNILGNDQIDCVFSGIALALHDLQKFHNELKVRLANVGSHKGALNLVQGFATNAWHTVENHTDQKECQDFEIFYLYEEGQKEVQINNFHSDFCRNSRMFSQRIKTAEERIEKCRDLLEKTNINHAEILRHFMAESNSLAACLLNCARSFNLFSKFSRVIIKCINLANDLWKAKRNASEYHHDVLLAQNMESSSSPMIVTTGKHAPIVEQLFRLWFRGMDPQPRTEIWHKQEGLKDALDHAFNKPLNTLVGLPPIKIFKSKVGSGPTILSNYQVTSKRSVQSIDFQIVDSKIKKQEKIFMERFNKRLNNQWHPQIIKFVNAFEFNDEHKLNEMMEQVEVKLREANQDKEQRKLKAQYRDQQELSFDLNWKYLQSLDQDFMTTRNQEILHRTLSIDSLVQDSLKIKDGGHHGGQRDSMKYSIK